VLSVDSYYSPELAKIKTEKELCINYSPAPAYSKHFGPDNVAIIYQENEFKLKIRVVQHRIYDLLLGPWVFSVIPNFVAPRGLDCRQYTEKNKIVIKIEVPDEIPIDCNFYECKVSTADGTIYTPSSTRRTNNGYILFFDTNKKKISSFSFQIGKMIIRQVEFHPRLLQFEKSNGVIYSILNP